MLNLAGFNSTIYSFNNKTWVSLTPTDETLAIDDTHGDDVRGGDGDDDH